MKTLAHILVAVLMTAVIWYLTWHVRLAFTDSDSYYTVTWNCNRDRARGAEGDVMMESMPIATSTGDRTVFKYTSRGDQLGTIIGIIPVRYRDWVGNQSNLLALSPVDAWVDRSNLRIADPTCLADRRLFEATFGKSPTIATDSVVVFRSMFEQGTDGDCVLVTVTPNGAVQESTYRIGANGVIVPISYRTTNIDSIANRDLLWWLCLGAISSVCSIACYRACMRIIRYARKKTVGVQ